MSCGKKCDQKILFINPPYSRFLGKSNRVFPMSFGSMATMLSDEGYEVGIYDADFDLRFVNETGITSYYESFRSQNRVRDGLFNSNHEIWQECRETLRRFRPDIVGITAMTSKFPMVTKIAEIIREEVPQASVFIGGHHATIFGRELLENRDFDFAVVGEGEYTVMELVHALTWKGNGDLSLIKRSEDTRLNSSHSR